MKNKEKEKFIIDVIEHIITTKSTIRQTANKFKISKSTVHKYCSKYIPEISYSLYLEVNKVLSANKEASTVRGGNATRQKNIDNIKSFADEFLSNLNNS